MVLTVYSLMDMPRIRALIHRLFPHSRRPRAMLIGDDILRKVGAYVLGNLLVSLIAGVLTFGWLLIFGTSRWTPASVSARPATPRAIASAER